MIDWLLGVAFRVFYRMDAVENRTDDRTVVSLSLRITPRFGWSPFGVMGQ